MCTQAFACVLAAALRAVLARLSMVANTLSLTLTTVVAEYTVLTDRLPTTQPTKISLGAVEAEGSSEALATVLPLPAMGANTFVSTFLAAVPPDPVKAHRAAATLRAPGLLPPV